MFKWLSALAFLATLSAVGSGCTHCHMGHRPLRPGIVCDPTYCTDTCGPIDTCGSVWGDRCGIGSGIAECDSYDACGPCCYGHYSPFGPLAFIGRLFRPITWVGPSCGERYWGGYWSDPPDCCDPCDSYGNYVGMHVRNHPRGLGGAHDACADYSCRVGSTAAGHHAASVEYAGAPQPAVPVRQQPAYLGQHPPLVRPPVGAAASNPGPASRYSPRVISVDDQVVGDQGPEATATARRLDAVRRQ